MFEELSNQNNLLQPWDELTTYFDGIGTGKYGGGGSGSYEKSILNTLSNGQEFYEYTTKSGGKQTICRPRLSIYGGFHTAVYINMLLKEGKGICANGHISRFIVVNPESIRLRLCKVLLAS